MTTSVLFSSQLGLVDADSYRSPSSDAGAPECRVVRWKATTPISCSKSSSLPESSTPSGVDGAIEQTLASLAESDLVEQQLICLLGYEQLGPGRLLCQTQKELTDRRVNPASRRSHRLRRKPGTPTGSGGKVLALHAQAPWARDPAGRRRQGGRLAGFPSRKDRGRANDPA